MRPSTSSDEAKSEVIESGNKKEVGNEKAEFGSWDNFKYKKTLIEMTERSDFHKSSIFNLQF
jgi:hypothetical protein